MRIFLAEDNLGDVFLIEEALKRQSLVCEIDHYATAEEAIRAAHPAVKRIFIEARPRHERPGDGSL